jgi:hypothetical protein
VKIGSDGTNKALETHREEAARSQIFAAHLPPDLGERSPQTTSQGKTKKPKK